MKKVDVNLIVHLYWKVDNRRVYEVIHQNLGDLDTFRQQISAWISS
ncbi:MAG: HepT-like ribonuclease domain-containing protein [Anaerolineae bacterium]